ncbi:MAG TPA: formylglycine-generating enzyme family protein [Blastocatellia bacterium]|nr:formylglycine-generating enzyme family protein [Blastocatellia bacterium]
MTRTLAFITGVAVAAAAALLALEARTDFEMPGNSSTASASVDAHTGETSLGCHPAPEPIAAPTDKPPSAEVISTQPENNTATASSPDAPKDIPEDMRLIRGGRFLMGADDGLPVEAPVHQVLVKDFWIDRHAVTVNEFAAFIRNTGYKTESERLGWSGVFDVRAGRWMKVDGADWRHPEGPASSASPMEPVTQVTWNDAEAYAAWARKRLPTEAEFEYAARGGLAQKKYAWGDELTPQNKYRANWWQGSFPDRNTGGDGFIGRAPVGSFPANRYGLYDMTGNVWEWCADRFGENYYRVSPADNPQGPDSGGHRVIRGGSWLCSDNYCTGYRVAARNHTAPDTGLNNLGFRCVRDR